MTCHHLTINAERTGARGTCIKCKTEVIFDGTKWVWLYSVDEVKRRKLITAYNVDRLTGAHT